MPDLPVVRETALEVTAPDKSEIRVRVSESPFLIGRGQENHLPLQDQRISRQCAAIVFEGGTYYLEDRGHKRGISVNGEKIDRQTLKDGDRIDFGLEDSYKIVFRCAAEPEAEPASIENLLSEMETTTSYAAGPSGLEKLNLLLQATRLLHSQLPLDAVLETMLDHGISVTNADRGLLLEADEGGVLRPRLARRSGSLSYPADSFEPSQTAVRLALKQQSGVITEDSQLADAALQGAQSIVAQRLRAVVAIPLYAATRAKTPGSVVPGQHGKFLGVLYLDSRRPAAFSQVDRQILDAIAIQSASILDNARLVERERQRQRIEQELSIARQIQQALLPRALQEFPHLAVAGMNTPCLDVGGDYFDVFPVDEHRTAFLIADVSGKGLGAALLTPMLQGALSGMALGANPASVFGHINRFLCDHAEVGRYATLFFGILDREGNLEYLNAGHPSPVLLRGGEATDLYTEGSFPIGLVPEASYETRHAWLGPDDTLVLFSDGVTEAEDVRQKQFGSSRLRELLKGRDGAPLEELQRLIVNSVEEFSRGTSQADDITLLLVRYRQSPQAAVAGA